MPLKPGTQNWKTVPDSLQREAAGTPGLGLLSLVELIAQAAEFRHAGVLTCRGSSRAWALIPPEHL